MHGNFRKVARWNVSVVMVVVSVCFLAPTQVSAIINGDVKQGDASPYVYLRVLETIEETQKGPKIRVYSCSGTLIGERHVVSAAHCFADKNDRLFANFRVEVFVSDVTGTKSKYTSLKVTPHPLYGRKKFVHDLAVIEVSTPIVNASFLPYGGFSLKEIKKQVLSAVGSGMTTAPQCDGQTCTLPPEAGESKVARTIQTRVGKLAQLVEYSLRSRSVTGAICFGDSGGSLVMNDASVKGPVLVGVLFAEEIGDGDCARNQAINSVDLYYYSRWIYDVSSVAPTVPPRTVFEVFGDGVVARDVAKKSVRETICNQRWVSGKQAKFVTSLADADDKNTLRADPDFASPVRYPDALIPVALGGEFSVKNIAWFSTDPLDRHSKENRSATAAAISARVCAGKITFAKGLAKYRAYLNK